QLPEHLRQQQFDHVFANPPYFQRDRSTAAQDAGRDIAFAGETPLADWVAVAAKRCKAKGYVSFIQRAERLPELISAMGGVLGSLQLLPLIPRAGREAQLVLVRGRKNGRADFRLHDGLVLHQGAYHGSDGEDYAPDIQAVLRDGAALPFPV
ncbi:MAG: methyltransferase, partial [Pseudomonadota bacterium]|nr:methyltransferase [Pseudomonadota bacterium]